MSTSCLIKCRRVVSGSVDELSQKCVDELFFRRVVLVSSERERERERDVGRVLYCEVNDRHANGHINCTTVVRLV